MYAKTHKLPALWFVSICPTDEKAVLKLLNDSNDIFAGALYNTETVITKVSQRTDSVFEFILKNPLF